MPETINCFKIHGRPDLQKKFNETFKEGMSAKEVAHQIIVAEHESLHNEMEGLKKQVLKNYTPKAYEQPIKADEKKPTEVPIQTKEEVGATETSDQTIKPTEEGATTGDGQEMRLTHADTEEIYKEAGLPERLDTPTKHREQLEAEAEDKLKKGYDFDKVADKVMEGKYKFEDTDQLLFARKVADLKAKQEGMGIKSPEFEMAQNQIEKLSRASDVAGTEIGRALQSRKNFVPVDETISDYVSAEKQSAGVETLTDNQKERVKKEYEDISEAKKKFDEYMAQKESEFAAKQAQAGFEKQKPSVKTKKTREDFVKERQTLKEKLSAARKEHEDWLKSQGIQKSGFGSFTVKEAKVIGEFIKSYAEEGIQKFEDAVKKVIEEVKDLFPGIDEKDIHNIAAGVYNEKKQSKSELAARIIDWRIEAGLINKLDALERGEEPKSEKKKIERNKQITELRGKIKDFDRKKTEEVNRIKAEEKAAEKAKADAAKEEEKFIREFEKEKDSEEKRKAKAKVDDAKKVSVSLEKKTKDESVLQSMKTRMANEIKELEYKLKTGDFDKESAPAKPPLKLDEEGKNLKDKLVKLKQERQIRLLQQEYANRSVYKKTTDRAIEILNVPRTIMSSMDFSAPLRQGLIASISHPRTAGLAGIEMFKQAFSQKRFDRWFYDLKESKNYDLMQKSDLYVSDPHDPKLSAKEEAFMNNLAEKIPIAGRLIKGSERAYVGYLNKLRVDLFNRFAERYISFGKTFENSPELYKQMADYVNNSTGRGKLGFAENAAPMLNTFLFSPRLIASRINLLTKPFTPSFYTKTPKEIRVMYAKDMLKFIGLGMTVLALAKLNGAEVEDDPRSTDFGKIKSGNTRWDIWGGFQPYIRVFSQMVTGEKKNVTDKQIKELNGDHAFGETRGDVVTRFARGKLAPVPSMVWDFLSARTVTGDKPTIGSEAESHLLPLLYSDVKSAMQDKGVSSLFTVGIPSAFGVGVQTFSPNTSSSKKPSKPSKPHKPVKH